MGLIAFLAGGAMLLVKAYRWLRGPLGTDGEQVIASISTQAAVIGTLANVVFAIFDAFTTMKVASARVPLYSSAPSPSFATRPGQTLSIPRA
jgi:hypothetical protein